MPAESHRLRAADVRAVYLLVGECCELGADPLIWRRHMLERLNGLFGAYSSIEIEATIDPAVPGIGAKVDAAMTIDHFTRPERDLLTRCLREMPMEANPLGMKLFGACPPGGAVAAARREQVSDAHWRRCAFWTEYFNPLGWDDMMVAIVKTPDGFRCYNFSRLKSERSFAARSARMLEAFARELAGISPVRLAPLSGGSLLDLPARECEVLAALAAGDSEKQVATRLGISRHTVHEYVRRLLARYGVSSRSELLVRAARQLHALELAQANGDGELWHFRRDAC